MIEPPPKLNLDELDLEAIETILASAHHTRDSLISGISAIRAIEETLDPNDRVETHNMIEQLASLILAWDELLRQTESVLNERSTQEQNPANKPN